MLVEDKDKIVTSDEVPTDGDENIIDAEAVEKTNKEDEQNNDQKSETSFEPTTVPLSALKDERKKRQEAQSQLDSVNQEKQELSKKVNELEQQLEWTKRKAEREGVEITDKPKNLTQEHIDKIREEHGDDIADALELSRAEAPKQVNENPQQDNQYAEVEKALQDAGLLEWKDLADSGIEEYQNLWNGVVKTEKTLTGSFNSLTERFNVAKETYIKSLNKPIKEPHKTLSGVGEIIKDESLVDKFSKLSGKNWQAEYEKLPQSQKELLIKELG
jgi:chromosome segregation ATPase